MHILVSNDDGPPSAQSSPYILCWVRALQKAGHVVSVCLPSSQRSWVGKAHIYGQTLTPTYYTPPKEVFGDVEGVTRKLPGRRNKHVAAAASGSETDADASADKRAEADPDAEWILLDGTPASTVQVGLHHYFGSRGPIDLVISGPNYGRNSTACFALSSGTLGAALEAATCGVKAIALSFAFPHHNTYDQDAIVESCRHGIRIVDALVRQWPADGGADLYSVNIPLKTGIEKEKVVFADILQNYWGRGVCTYKAVDVPSDENEGEGEGELSVDTDLEEVNIRQKGEIEGRAVDERKRSDTSGLAHKHFQWAPELGTVWKSVEDSQPGNDGWVVAAGITSVTPLKANFWHAEKHLLGRELKLSDSPRKDQQSASLPSIEPVCYAIVAYEDDYVQPLIVSAIDAILPKGTIHYLQPPLSSEVCLSALLPSPDAKVLQIGAYEALDFDFISRHPATTLANSYVIRKALIRKHFLSTTVDHWVAKMPFSVLGKHVLRTEAFEVDYAEFLDDALVEAFDLRESLGENEKLDGEDEAEKQKRQWWILKPGMSDRGQGIRLFSTTDELQAIFDGWEENTPDGGDEDDEDDGNGNGGDYSHINTSHLRHFIAQPYIHPPLLLPDGSGRKFHVRVYVLCVGRLKVYVYRPMLALAAAKRYVAPWDGPADLGAHLTNTCLQTSHHRQVPTPSAAITVQPFWTLGFSDATKESVFDQICAVTGEVFEAAARAMAVHFQPLENAFEVFGLDFLVDAEENAWLLEINAFPDFKQTGDELRGVVGGFWAQVVDKAVGPFAGVDGKENKDEGDMVLVREVGLGRVG